MSYRDAVSVQVYLTDMDLFARRNAWRRAAAQPRIEISVTARK